MLWLGVALVQAWEQQQAAVGAIPSGLTGAGIGFATGRTVRIAENETALAFNEFQKFKDENGQTIDKNTQGLVLLYRVLCQLP